MPKYLNILYQIPYTKFIMIYLLKIWPPGLAFVPIFGHQVAPLVQVPSLATR